MPLSLRARASDWAAAADGQRRQSRPASGNSRPPGPPARPGARWRAAVVEQLVEHGADGAAGVEHVVEHQGCRRRSHRTAARSVPLADARPRWAKSSRCITDESTPGGPSTQAQVPCRRSASQAPPGNARQARGGAEHAAHAAQQFAVQASASSTRLGRFRRWGGHGRFLKIVRGMMRRCSVGIARVGGHRRFGSPSDPAHRRETVVLYRSSGLKPGLSGHAHHQATLGPRQRAARVPCSRWCAVRV